MTPEERQQLKELIEFKKNMEASSTIPLKVDQAIRERFANSSSGLLVLSVPNGGTGAATLTGILKGNGTSAFTAIVPISGTGSFYVAATSGGLVTTKVDYNNGIITAIT